MAATRPAAARDVNAERGPYLTHSRALELERRIAQVEERARARIDQIEEELAALRKVQGDQIRAQVRALMEVLQPGVTRRARGGDD